MAPITHYPNIEAFYQDRGGRDSGERNYGVWHYDDIGLFSPRSDWPLEPEELEIGGEVATVFNSQRSSGIRVSVVDETGDVYAVQEGLGEGRVALIGNVGLENPHFRAPRTVKGHIGPVYRRANEILTDWMKPDDPERRPLGRGISWSINRLAEAASVPRTQEVQLSDWSKKLTEMQHMGFVLVDGILPEVSEETFANFTMMDALIFMAYRMYSEQIWESRWAKPDGWYKADPSRLSFRDWLLYEFRHQLARLSKVDTDELAEVRYQWIAAMEIVSEDTFGF